MNDWPVGSFPIHADGVYPSESGLLALPGTIWVSVSKQRTGASIIVERFNGTDWCYAGTINKGQRRDHVYVNESGYYRVRVSEFKRSFTMTFENTR